jgi:hypothetical protein
VLNRGFLFADDVSRVVRAATSTLRRRRGL